MLKKRSYNVTYVPRFCYHDEMWYNTSLRTSCVAKSSPLELCKQHSVCSWSEMHASFSGHERWLSSQGHTSSIIHTASPQQLGPEHPKSHLLNWYARSRRPGKPWAMTISSLIQASEQSKEMKPCPSPYHVGGSPNTGQSAAKTLHPHKTQWSHWLAQNSTWARDTSSCVDPGRNHKAVTLESHVTKMLLSQGGWVPGLEHCYWFTVSCAVGTCCSRKPHTFLLTVFCIGLHDETIAGILWIQLTNTAEFSRHLVWSILTITQ
jgi:hypothetical protein